MHPDLEALRPKLKEILYDCAVEIRATKAALYFSTAPGRFELVSEYGFRSDARPNLDTNDPIVDRCGRGRTPFFINGLAVEPRFSERLFEASTDRLLVAPIFSRGQLVGLIDMRDKAAKQPFEQDDIPKAQRIGERLLEVVAAKNILGQRFIALSDVDEDAAPPIESAWSLSRSVPATPKVERPKVPVALPSLDSIAAPARPAPTSADAPPGLVGVTIGTRPSAAPSQQSAPAPRTPNLAAIIADAHTATADLYASIRPETITEAEVAAARDVLPLALLIPNTMVAVFTAYGHLGGVQEIVSRGPLTEDSKTIVMGKLATWLEKRGESPDFVASANESPLSSAVPPIVPIQLQKVFTAPVLVGSVRRLYLTVAFSEAPDRASHEMLALVLNQLQAAIEHSLEHDALHEMRRRVAAALIEPRLERLPALRQHSDAVAELAESFARQLMLSPSEVEIVRLVAVVHDAGLRLLDYERLYQKRAISPEEREIIREHPVVGAAIVEPLLGKEVAASVLAHHERFDGGGYPHALAGAEIPVAARIVQICDVYVALTDRDSYQTPIPPADALRTITQVAGTQLDPELVARFVEMMARR